MMRPVPLGNFVDGAEPRMGQRRAGSGFGDDSLAALAKPPNDAVARSSVCRLKNNDAGLKIAFGRVIQPQSSS